MAKIIILGFITSAFSKKDRTFFKVTFLVKRSPNDIYACFSVNETATSQLQKLKLPLLFYFHALSTHTGSMVEIISEFTNVIDCMSIRLEIFPSECC